MNKNILLIAFAIFSFLNVVSAQTYINPATLSDHSLNSLGGGFWGSHYLETSISECSQSASGYSIVFAFDGQPLNSNLTCIDPRIAITDDKGGEDNFQFSNCIFPNVSPTKFFYPDVTLLNDGTKAIVVVETDDYINGAYMIEFNITYPLQPGSITQVGTAQPVNQGSGIYTTMPRIDGDQDFANGNDRFAIVAIQNNTPVYIIYENTGAGYAPMPPFASGVLAANSGAITNDCFFPDIAIGHVKGGNTPECVISYVDGSKTGSVHNNLLVDYLDPLAQTSTNQFNYNLATNVQSSNMFNPIFWNYNYAYQLLNLTNPNSYVNNERLNYPHICSNPEFNNIGSMEWALTESLNDPNIGFPNNHKSHLLYVNSTYNNGLNPSALIYLDDIAPQTYNFRQSLASIDWLTDDGMVAWKNQHFTQPTPYLNLSQYYGFSDVVGVKSPLINSPSYHNSWDQIYSSYSFPMDLDPQINAVSVASSRKYVVVSSMNYNVLYKVDKITNSGVPNNFIGLPLIFP